jgi:uncharacterized protein
MFGKLNTDEIEALIKRQFIGRIGCHTGDTTYVVPISFAYDGTYIYSHTYEGMKIQMMRKNPKVCFEVDDTKNLANWQSVIAWGVFEELVEGPEREAAVRLLESRALPFISSETMHLSSLWPFDSPKPNEIDGIIFRIKLTEKTGRFETSPAASYYAT